MKKKKIDIFSFADGKHMAAIHPVFLKRKTRVSSSFIV